MKILYLACLASLVAAMGFVSPAQSQVATKLKPKTDTPVPCVGDYRQIVRCALAAALQSQISLQEAEISPLRPSRLTQPGDKFGLRQGYDQGWSWPFCGVPGE
jgi:hypothetical protein